MLLSIKQCRWLLYKFQGVRNCGTEYPLFYFIVEIKEYTSKPVSYSEIVLTKMAKRGVAGFNCSLMNRAKRITCISTRTNPVIDRISYPRLKWKIRICCSFTRIFACGLSRQTTFSCRFPMLLFVIELRNNS